MRSCPHFILSPRGDLIFASSLHRNGTHTAVRHDGATRRAPAPPLPPHCGGHSTMRCTGEARKPGTRSWPASQRAPSTPPDRPGWRAGITLRCALSRASARSAAANVAAAAANVAAVPPPTSPLPPPPEPQALLVVDLQLLHRGRPRPCNHEYNYAYACASRPHHRQHRAQGTNT